MKGDWAFEREKCLERSIIFEDIRVRVFFSEYVALSTIFVSLHWLLSEQNLEVKDFADCGWLECSIDIKFWEGVYYEI